MMQVDKPETYKHSIEIVRNGKDSFEIIETKAPDGRQVYASGRRQHDLGVAVANWLTRTQPVADAETGGG